MKKKAIIVLAIVICLAAVIFAVSKTGDEAQQEPGKTVSVGDIIETTENTEEDEEPQETEPTEAEKKDPDKIVKVEIPLAFIDYKYQNDLDSFAEDNGYESAKLSRDKKTVTVEMRALSYDLYLTQVGITTIKTICDTFESENYPYVINLGEYNEDFSYVTLLVDSKGFKNATNVDELFEYVSNCCAYYLLQDNDSPDEFKIDICNKKNGKLLATRSYSKNNYLG